MSLKIGYDFDADRMILTCKSEEQQSRVLWLNRNQCLDLLAKISVASKAMGFTLKLIQPLRSVPVRPKRKLDLIDQEPERLNFVRLRRDGEQLKVVLIPLKDKGISLTLKPEAAVELHKILAIEATKAGWDPIAGLNRLTAIAQARRAKKEVSYQ